MSSLEHLVKREAFNRQGTTIRWGKNRLFIPGGKDRALFPSGKEGLVQLAVDQDTHQEYRIKCFFDPSRTRFERSKQLAAAGLADRGKSVADALAGAPFGILDSLGPNTPFAVIMKNIPGLSWLDLQEKGIGASTYPPPDWSPVEVRATWAYGLATAVLTMENKHFIHADLSPGNVMMTPSGDTAGDMALVDFDSFVHPSNPQLDRSCIGTEGYAAPEIRRKESVGTGTDRLAMAILIQEFIVAGDSTISCDEAFTWKYDQDQQLGLRRGNPHPLLVRKYPQLAELVSRAISAPTLETRPSPAEWRPLLRRIVMDNRLGPRLRNGVLVPSTPSRENVCVDLDAITEIDLRMTPFAIRVKLKRDPEGRISCLAHPGADVQIRFDKNSHWQHLQPGEPKYALPGMVLFDRDGKVSARVVAEALAS